MDSKKIKDVMGELTTVLRFLIFNALEKAPQDLNVNFNSNPHKIVFECQDDTRPDLRELANEQLHELTQAIDFGKFHLLHAPLKEDVTNARILRHVACSGRIVDNRLEDFEVKPLGDFKTLYTYLTEGEPDLEEAVDGQVMHMSRAFRKTMRTMHDALEAMDVMRANMAHQLVAFESNMARLGMDTPGCYLHVPDQRLYVEEPTEQPAKRAKRSR